MKKQLTDRAEMLGGMINRLGEQLFNSFADDGVNNVRVLAKDPRTGQMVFEDGQDRIVSPQIKYKGHSPTEAREAFFTWLRKNGSGEIIKESVHDATLSSWLEDQITAKKELPPQEILKVTELETVTVRKAPKSAEGSKE